MIRPTYVVKIGSSTLFGSATIFDEIAALAGRGARVLLVAGGAKAIEKHYGRIEREVRQLVMKNGDEVRYCSPEEMPHIAAAYEEVSHPHIARELTSRGLRCCTTIAARNALVTAVLNKPLRVTEDGREKIVKDHRVGTIESCDVAALSSLLDQYQVVCISAPVVDKTDGGLLNVDADVLAAHLSNALGADHLRFVTSTPGIMRDLKDPTSGVTDVYPGDDLAFVKGRMKQKLRAANLAIAGGTADVAITGPNSFAGSAGRTWFWSSREPSADLALVSKAIEIVSHSGDESELADYLCAACKSAGLESFVDEAGNLVATKGTGAKRLLMMGHLDTVPFRWKVRWGAEGLTGRGSVDAKSSLVNFLEVLRDVEVPPGAQVMVVGATEEEVSSSKGAFFARDNYPAQAVIVGEPSGAEALTIGYFGLFKLKLTSRRAHGHSAGANAMSASDAIIQRATGLRARVKELDPDGLSSLISIRSWDEQSESCAEAILNFRVSPKALVGELETAVTQLPVANDDVSIEVLRATPGAAFGRSSPLARGFARSFSKEGITARYLVKKGTSDMNTLATTWSGVPMVAYGPGDSSLDHTDHEHVSAEELRKAKRVLQGAVTEWLAGTEV